MEKIQQTVPYTQKHPAGIGKMVLVVDDDDGLLELNKFILESDGYRVFTALSGRDALKILSEIDRPDLILLDMCMEDMSGPDFLTALEEKQPEVLTNVPVVFLTGMYEAPASKAKGFIRKPIAIKDFLLAVHHFIALGVGKSPSLQ